MSVTVSLSLAAEEFPLGRVFQALPDARIELERVIPSGEALLPYAWVYGEDAETVRAAIETTDHVSHVDVLDALPDRTLVRIDWEPSVDGVIDAIADHQAAILEADGDADRWRFGLRFPSSDAASRFQTACREASLHLDINSVHDTTEKGTDRSHDLTAPQREVLERAFEDGYFDIPRQTTLVTIADEFGISDQAASERLRRALRRLAATYLGR